MKIIKSNWIRVAGLTLLALVPLLLMVVSLTEAATSNVDFSQCANHGINGIAAGPCDFINGNINQQNGAYYDGMAVPQREMWESIAATTGNTHTLRFGYEWTNTGDHAYDFLVSWNQAKQLSALIAGLNMTEGYSSTQPTADDPCQKVKTAGGSYDACRTIHSSSGYSSTYTMPDNDTFVSTNCDSGQCNVADKQAFFSSVFGPRTFTIWANAPITVSSFSLAHYSDKGCSVPTSNESGSDTYVCTTIIYTSTATIIDLEVAPHIALGCDSNQPRELYWGCTHGGASAISGSPYHFFSPSAAGLDGEGGSMDNQLQVANSPPVGHMNTSVQSIARAINQPITDTVIITGTAPLAGNIGFFICGPTLSAQPCIAGTQVGVTTTVSGSPATVVSSNYIGQAVGSYCFRVAFSSTNTVNQSTNSWTTSGTPNGECVSYASATAVALSTFQAPQVNSSTVTLSWATASEVNTAGFNIYRAEKREGPYVQINSQIIPTASDKVAGGKYQYQDKTVEPGKTYYYQLEDVELGGTTKRHDPIVVNVPAESTVDANLMLIGSIVGGFVVMAGGLFIALKKVNVF